MEKEKKQIRKSWEGKIQTLKSENLLLKLKIEKNRKNILKAHELHLNYEKTKSKTDSEIRINSSNSQILCERRYLELNKEQMFYPPKIKCHYDGRGEIYLERMENHKGHSLIYSPKVRNKFKSNDLLMEKINEYMSTYDSKKELGLNFGLNEEFAYKYFNRTMTLDEYLSYLYGEKPVCQSEIFSKNGEFQEKIGHYLKKTKESDEISEKYVKSRSNPEIKSLFPNLIQILFSNKES